MIKTRYELKSIIKKEKAIYFHQGEIKQKIVCSKNAIIFKYQKYLRKEEYYINQKKNIFNILCIIYYKRKKNRLGQKLGFDIPANCFDSGLRIYHVAPVTVNKDARIGKNCSIFGNVCIGVSDSGVPSIGNNCTLGYGSKVIGGVKIANNCIIGAGSVVTKSVEEEYSRIAGIPAKRL